MKPEYLKALQEIRLAAKAIRVSGFDLRNSVLETLAQKLKTFEPEILAANAVDLAQVPADSAPAFLDRLTLNPTRLTGMIESLRQVAALPDPLGEITEQRVLANGLRVKRVRSALGVIFMIFESRPNVAIEAFSLAFKAGNPVILRGGKESRHTIEVFYRLMRESLSENQLPPMALFGITDPDRSLVLELLHAKKYIDVVVPRGGDQLIEFVVENSKIPIIKNDRGMCHIFVDETANLSNAENIIENAKVQRPGVCNSVETILVHASVATKFLPKLHDRLSQGKHPVEWFVCGESARILDGRARVNPITADSFDTEYLDYKLNCKVVSGLAEAIAHIEAHGSRHSEAIVTENSVNAHQFENEVDAAAVYWNASTRFTDGFELGLGGELGISTQKLHVRGPVGLRELTSVRWILEGDGQTRR
jgi:glutamate-5-semialdehyde dehydrogenase